MIYDLVIIGFGISGICMSSVAKQNNLNFCVLEKTNNYGGIWNYALNTSRLQTHKSYYEFPDYKMPYNYDNYPCKTKILEYLKNYINHHNLDKYVKYNSNVIKVVYKENIWIVTTINGIYHSKYLCISSGYNFHKKIPKNLNYNNFNGKIFHSNELSVVNITNTFSNKNVVIIGNGASACDLLNSINKITNNLYVVYRNNKYYIDRTLYGISLSIILNKLVIKFFKNLNVKIYILLFKIFNSLFFGNYLDLPHEKVNNKNLIASNIITKLLKQNKLYYIKDNIIDFFENNIILNEHTLYNIDIIVFATGYESNIDFEFSYDINCNKYYNIILPENSYCGVIGFAPSYNWLITSYKQSQFFVKHILENKKLNKDTIIKHINSYKKKKDKYNLSYNDLTYELFD